MPWIACPDCEEQIVVRGDGVYTCPECGRKVRHERDDDERDEEDRRARVSLDPWYVNWVRWLCYTHLIVMLVVLPIALLVELIFGLLSFGFGLPIFFAHLVMVPMCFLPGLIPLLVVDLWRVHAKGRLPAR